MKNKAWIVGLALLTMAILPGYSGNALAATVNVPTNWNVAQDTSFSVSFPANTSIDFDPASGTFTDLAATGQTDAQWAYRVTNDGNINIDVAAVFLAPGFPSGVSEFQTCTASSGGAPSGTCWWWDNTNETSNPQTIISALTPGSNADRWAWSTGSGVIAGTYGRVYQLTSTAV